MSRAQKDETVRNFLETSARFLQVAVRSRELAGSACSRGGPIEQSSGDGRGAGPRV
jgi:hypothetical protein